MPNDIRSRALGYIREGRVVILTAASLPGAPRPSLIAATVQGHQRRYEIWFTAANGWICDCALAQTCQDCPHIAAAALVTGQPQLAGRPEQQEAPAITAGATTSTT